MSYTQPYLTVSPVNSSHIGVWNVYLKQVRISTNTSNVFVSAIITVGCQIEKFTLPVDPVPADATYTIYDDRKYINFDTFKQYPPCGYVVNEFFTWTIPALSPITQGSGNYQL